MSRSQINYSIVARRHGGMRVSRHGISRSQGGQLVEKSDYQWPDTPIYLALEIERDLHPDCDLEIVGLPKPE